eukprot:gene14581-22119_t
MARISETQTRLGADRQHGGGTPASPAPAWVTESIDELARALNLFEGGVVLISHDMRLIAQVCSQIFIAEHKKVTLFKGDIAAYKKVVAKKVLATCKKLERDAKPA